MQLRLEGLTKARMIPKPFEDQQDTALVSFLRPGLRPHFFAFSLGRIPMCYMQEQNNNAYVLWNWLGPNGPSPALAELMISSLP